MRALFLGIIRSGSKKLHFQNKNGAGEEARTLDFQLGRLALYQLSYTRVENKISSKYANFNKWWRGNDLNIRRLTPADLQSAPFDHSGTTPHLMELLTGVEPATYGLQNRCSTN
jgi:hypothetical protein